MVSAATYLLDVVVKAGLVLVVQDALTLDAEVEAVQYIPEAAHLLKDQSKSPRVLGGGDETGRVKQRWLSNFARNMITPFKLSPGIEFAFHLNTEIKFDADVEAVQYTP